MKSNAVKGKLYSDICIDVDTSKFKSTSLDGAEEMFKAGYDATIKLMPKIKELIYGKEKKKFSLLNLFRRNKKNILKEQRNNSIDE